MFYPDIFTFSYFGLITVAMAIATATHILLNKQDEPTSSVLWLLVAFSFPGIGVLLYLIFGVNRTHTKGLRVELARKKLHDTLNERDTPREEEREFNPAFKAYVSTLRKYEATAENGYPPHQKMLDRLLPDTTPLTGNRVRLLSDGTEAYPAMLAAMEKAESSIHLQSYIIMNDTTGGELFDLLHRKAKSGVKVKVLYDRFGSWAAFSTFFFSKFLHGTPNMEIRPFSLKMPWTIQLRNHRKLLVCDGRVGFIGGINIGKGNISSPGIIGQHIHDLHCEITGSAVAEMQFLFLRDWHCTSECDPRELVKPEHFPEAVPAGDSIVRLVASGPGQSFEAAEMLHMTATATAESSIWIMTPYFVPDKPFLKELRNAVARGVEVRIIVPAKNNHWYMKLASSHLYPFLLESGVRILEKRGDFSHVKAMLVDGNWCRMGSSNCDVRSFKLNYELDAVIEGGKFPNELHEQFIKEMAEAEEIFITDMDGKSMPRQLIESLCALFTPIL
ncbi:MAG: cardiolipin synthase [Kiritimatiellaeota bacterium]|nr:cardiolipin synthase [Kiritimatiellota bacterium]